MLKRWLDTQIPQIPFKTCRWVKDFFVEKFLIRSLIAVAQVAIAADGLTSATKRQRREQSREGKFESEKNKIKKMLKMSFAFILL
jgi:hypothetical protein